ncbi:MAG: hypothetical protein ACRCXZ_01895 [Patescibacteria group bacterium]
MPEFKDQNHIFPEPEMDAKKSNYRPMLADDDSVIEIEKNQSQKITSNKNVSLKGVIKDISNTNLEALVRIKKEDEMEHETEIIQGPKPNSSSVSTTPNIMEELEERTKESTAKKTNVFTYQKKEKFIDTSFGRFLKRFWWLVSLFVILSIAAAYFGVVTYMEANKKAPLISDLKLEIQGDSKIPKDAKRTWNVSLTNNSQYPLKDINVFMIYDSAFAFEEYNGTLEKKSNTEFKLPKLGKGEKQIFKIEGRFNKKDVVDIDTKMLGKARFLIDDSSYKDQKPQETLSNEFVTKVEKSIVRLDISIDGTVPIESDQTIKVDFTNQSGKQLNNFRLKMTYPTVGLNFNYISSEFSLPGRSNQTQPSNGDHTWNIVSLENGETGTVSIKSTIKGSPDNNLQFKAELINNDSNELIVSTNRDIKVVDKAISTYATIEGADFLQPDGTLSYKIELRNNYNTELRNVNVDASFVDNAELIDKEGFAASEGNPIINKNDKKLSFRGAGLPSLQVLGPKSSVVIKFNFKLKPVGAFNGFSQYGQDNYNIRPKVVVTGENFNTPPEVIGDKKWAKGGPIIKQSVEYLADGKKKMARITWEVKNKFSKLENLTIRTRSPLSTSTAWNKDSVTPPAQANNITYNKDSGEIVWKAGNVEDFMGSNGKELKVTFTITNDTDSTSVNFTDTPTFSVFDTLNTGFEFNQLNTPFESGGTVGPSGS